MVRIDKVVVGEQSSLVDWECAQVGKRRRKEGRSVVKCSAEFDGNEVLIAPGELVNLAQSGSRQVVSNLTARPL
jgi:hypothetical protein